MNSLAKSVQVGLFRHGATDWNAAGRLQGLTDTKLSIHGRDQVLRASDRIAEHAWEMIVSSPLSRARESAQILAERLKLPEPLILDAVTERAFGVGEGMKYSDWFELQRRSAAIQGAESDADVDSRVQAFLEAAQAFEGRRLLVVSHGGFIRRVIRRISSNTLPPPDSRLGNASLQRIGQIEGEWSVLEWNPASLADDRVASS